MGPSATIQHVRQIATLGLPAKAAVAAMVDALDTIVPTRTKIFFWVGEDNSAQDFYEREPIMPALDAYFSQTARLAADPDEPSFDKLANSPVEYGGWKRFERFAKWNRSILKNEVFATYQIGNNLDFTIRDGNRPIAVLALAREPGTASYTRTEINTVLATRQHFAHAMRSGAPLAPGQHLAEGDPALAVVGCDGCVVQSTPGADLLMHQLLTPGTGLRLRFDPAPAAVREVVRRLHAIRRGHAAPPPSMDVPTGFGLIRVVGQAITPTGEAMVTLQHHVARPLQRARRAAALNLSPREREVALAMCRPGDGDAIAASVGLSAASYREYARRIYRRLGVEGRLGLRDLLDS